MCCGHVLLTKGAKNSEEADAQAEHFLEQQELKSGLLVSRRSHSYRFVHLTFQEYLAAWNLAAQEVHEVAAKIAPYLRTPKWFEALQLLGGEWAKRSDETLNVYIEFLLKQQGHTITDKAPVIALCANVLNDTSGIAEVKPTPRDAYNVALKDTLLAFRADSRVPVKTQLEILEALGKLGYVVKDHLISATKSGYFQVRSRAIEILTPHLSDDEVFDLKHLLQDRSQVTITTYLATSINRDVFRTVLLLLNTKYIGVKIYQALRVLFSLFMQSCAPDEGRRLAIHLVVTVEYTYMRNWFLLQYAGHHPLDEEILPTIAQYAYANIPGKDYKALDAIGCILPGQSARQVVKEIACQNSSIKMRIISLQLLAKNCYDEDTDYLLRYRAINDSDKSVRRKALTLLLQNWKDQSSVPVNILLSPRYPPSPAYPGYVTAIDLRKQISSKRLSDCAAHLKIPYGDVLQMFVVLSQSLPLTFSNDVQQAVDQLRE